MAKHKVTRFADSQVYNKPHLILPDNLQQICSYLETRNGMSVWKDELIDAAVKSNALAEEYKESLGYGESESGCSHLYSVENGIAYLNIEGTLTYKPTFFSMICGGISYLELQDAAKEIAEDSGIKIVVLNIDSGGGEAYSCFSTASYIKDTLKNSGKKLITYVDGMMASAAYALGCSADEVIMNPDAQTGSVGVVVKLVDTAVMKEQEGVKDVYIYAGDKKVPFDDEGHFKKDFLDRLQTSVDETYLEFVNHVSEMRNIPTKDVVATQADIFRSNKAIELGLADKVMTRFEFEEYLSTLTNAEETELPYTVKPNHHEDDDEDEQAGCGKKKKTSHQELTSESVSESLTNISGDQSLENLEELLAMKAEFEANKQQMAELSAQIEQLNALKAQAEEQAAKLAAEKLAHQKAEKMQSLEAYNFMDAAQKEALVDFAMANESMGSMLFSMFAKANEAIGLAAQEVVAVKEAFGSEKGVDTALDVVVEAEKSAQEVIQERINAIKAQSAK